MQKVGFVIYLDDLLRCEAFGSRLNNNLGKINDKNDS